MKDNLAEDDLIRKKYIVKETILIILELVMIFNCYFTLNKAADKFRKMSIANCDPNNINTEPFCKAIKVKMNVSLEELMRHK